MAKNQNNDIKKAAKVAKSIAPSKATRKKIYKRSGFAKALPYISIAFAVILAICFILGEGAGVVGSGACAFMCGFLGGAAYLLPVYFLFIGLVWCIFDIKWQTKGADDGDIKAANRRAVVKSSLATVFVVLFSSLLEVFADHSVYELSVMWEHGGEDFVQGGIIGGAIGFLFNMAFDQIVSIVILVLLLLVCLFFTSGLSVSYIVARVRTRREMREKEVEIDEARIEKKYEMLRDKELERAKKRKERELEAEKKRQLAELVKEQNRAMEEEAQKSAKPQKPIKEEKSKQISDEEFDEIFEEKANDADDGIKITRVIAEPEDDEDDLFPSEDEQFSEYGGDDIIDGNTINLDDLLDEAVTEPVPATVRRSAAAEPENIDLNKISDDELSEDLAGVAPEEGETAEEEIVTPYVFPRADMLTMGKNPDDSDCQEELRENARILKDTLKSFKVDIREISYSRGPTITRYELKPEVGTRVRSIANLVDDIALSLATSGVRIEAPIPNKPAVGIEVPNRVRAMVYLRALIENSKFTDAKSRLTSCLGMDVGGNPVYFDIGKMPHLLIAGTTGSGKSVCINTIILSILFKARPDEVKLILVDPKQVEFTVYENIPHLYCPIVSEPKKAAGALASAVSEMERRFELIKSVGVRNIESYNEVTANDPEKEYLPKMVIIIDELADLMMTARDEVETSICRLAQKARAAGIHVILGTQRPSVDVITGLIKANIPSRIACTVTSQVDSRTIIDVAGAENLIGYGDMLFAPVGSSKPMRVQGAFVSDGEVEEIVGFIRKNNSAVKYNNEFIKSMEENAKACGNSKKGGSSADMESVSDGNDGGDSKFNDAVRLAITEGKISTSLMQRKLGIGYGRAAKIIDTMEEMGYVSAADGTKPRRVLITMEEYMRRTAEGSEE